MPRLRMIVIPKGVAIGLGSRGNWPGTGRKGRLWREGEHYSAYEGVTGT